MQVQGVIDEDKLNFGKTFWFTGTRDRAKLHRLSTNLRNQGSSEVEIQNHLRGWLQKRGKMHYHGTPYKFKGLPQSNARQRGTEGEDFSDNSVHVGTLKSAQERLGNRDMSVEFDADKTISPRIIPLTVNVGKNNHPLGSARAPFEDSTASNFGKNITNYDSKTGLPRSTRLPLSHLTPHSYGNSKGYKQVTPRNNQNIVVYRNGVEDQGSLSYSTNKPDETLKTLHNLANQHESLSNKSRNTLKNLISEKRSGFTGTRDRAKLLQLSTNLRKQGRTPEEIDNHLQGWLKKRGKLHYHGTDFSFQGAPIPRGFAPTSPNYPVTPEERRAENHNDFRTNRGNPNVHVGTLKAAQERMAHTIGTKAGNDGNTGQRILPLTINVSKNVNALGARHSPGWDSNTHEDLHTTRDRQNVQVQNQNGVRSWRRAKKSQEIYPYRNDVEDKGSISHAIARPGILRTIKDMQKPYGEYVDSLATNNNQSPTGFRMMFPEEPPRKPRIGGYPH